LDGPRERGNIVGRSVDGFYEFGSLRFCVLLSFQLGFQLQKLVLALKTGFRGSVRNRCKKPQAVQVEQTKGNIYRNVYSIVVMKTKDLRPKVTAKIYHT
jgi:hypothetical protein